MVKEQEKLELRFGLVGKDIDYSFSRAYFKSKFEKEDLAHRYENFDLPSIHELLPIVEQTPNLRGLNVTIPYKEEVLALLDVIDKRAKAIGAVNTIRITKNKQLIGYNTDFLGFKKSLEQHLSPEHHNALILGTGGASKAVAYALDLMNIKYDFVSRSTNKASKFLYSDLTVGIIGSYSIIINCTPIGTYPNVNACPDIPYEGIGTQHICYDLIYNPEQTKFLSCAELQGAISINGLEMLEIQAEEAWKIWMQG
jgi:shikimate dehydrogenase